mgnify:CR=1 FL=1
MRVIIEKDYEKLSKWAADHVIETINRFQPTAERPFVLGLPTGSSLPCTLPSTPVQQAWHCRGRACPALHLPAAALMQFHQTTLSKYVTLTP